MVGSCRACGVEEIVLVRHANAAPMSDGAPVRADQPHHWKKEDISLIISKGLAVTVREQPHQPIEFFGRWLQNYSKVQKAARAQEEEREMAQKLRDKNAFFIKADQAVADEEDKLESLKQTKNSDFW